jgi:hypothetical protein
MNNFDQELLGIEANLYATPSWFVTAVQSICETILRERDKGYTIFLEEYASIEAEELRNADEKKRPNLQLIQGDKE